MSSASSATASSSGSPSPISATAFVQVDGFEICPVDVSGGQASSEHRACWLILDGSGRVVARAPTQLLAIAKVQILLLTALTSRNADRSANSIPRWPL